MTCKCSLFFTYPLLYSLLIHYFMIYDDVEMLVIICLCVIECIIVL